MKKFLFLFCLVMLALFIFQSCEKCATCTETATVSGDTTASYYPNDSSWISKEFEACGRELKEADGKTTWKLNVTGEYTEYVTSCK
ncbi:MAG: hypothetical protein WCQ95_14885 [Bacteroidota bacterium]